MLNADQQRSGGCFGLAARTERRIPGLLRIETANVNTLSVGGLGIDRVHEGGAAYLGGGRSWLDLALSTLTCTSSTSLALLLYSGIK